MNLCIVGRKVSGWYCLETDGCLLRSKLIRCKDTKENIQYCEDSHVIINTAKSTSSSSEDIKHKRIIQKKNRTKRKLNSHCVMKVSSLNSKEKKNNENLKRKFNTEGSIYPSAPSKTMKRVSLKANNSTPLSATAHKLPSSLSLSTSDDLTKQFISEMKEGKRKVRGKRRTFNSKRELMRRKNTVKEVGLEDYREYCNELKKSKKNRELFVV
ncbi:unnamed protein product [Moneuplotes crassus]|uniref:Uncharacterized protein n=1 Tax=Euplotes crassus TaxID=5936 RepID=A0AAD1XAZ5_EUPCR|nr:unnamed protein product [Moneuplotes crassus]